jgi:hypothetical protein
VHSYAATHFDQAKRQTKPRAQSPSRREKNFHLDPSTGYSPFINSFCTDGQIAGCAVELLDGLATAHYA